MAKRDPGQAHVIPPAPKIYKTLVRGRTSILSLEKTSRISPFCRRTSRRMSREKPEKSLAGATRKHKISVSAVSLAVACTGPDALTGKTRIKEISRSINIFASPKRIIFTHTTSTTILMGMSNTEVSHAKISSPPVNWLDSCICQLSMWRHQISTGWWAKKFEPPHNLPLVANEPATVTPIGRTNFRNMAREFWSRPDDRRRHFYVIGKTGMGKSTLLENMIFDDIAKGRGVGVIDPRVISDKILDFIPKERTNDVILFSPSDVKYPVAFNLFENVSRELAPVVAGGFVNIFKRMFEDSWGLVWNTSSEIPSSHCSKCQEVRCSISQRYSPIKTTEKNKWKSKRPRSQKFWIEEFNAWTPKQMQEAVAPILNKVGQFLSSYMVRNMVAQPKNSFGLRWAMDKGKSSSWISQRSHRWRCEQYARRHARDEISDWCHESCRYPRKGSQRFLSLRRWISEFRDIQLCHYSPKPVSTSSISRWQINIYRTDERRSPWGSILKRRYTRHISSRTWRCKSPRSRSRKRRTHPPDDLMNLAKYQIYTKFLIDGMPSQVFSARTNPPVDVSNREKYQDKQKIIENSRQRYAKDQTKSGENYQVKILQ